MMEGGGVVVPNQGPDQGFFHMPKLQVPTYQKPRVFVPGNFNPRPAHDVSANTAEPNQRQVVGPPIMPNATQLSGATTVDGMFDGKRIRKTMVRKTVDYNTSAVKYLENRVWQRDGRDARAIQPDALYQLEVTPPSDMQQKPMNCLTSKFMRQSTNKFRCPIFCISWTPEGRRLVTGASSGEFTLWNGLTFSFETILQAHETSVRAMVWSHNDQWMLTADHAGFIKYWQSNMNNVKMYQGHKEPIRSIRWDIAPSSGQYQHRSKVYVTLPVNCVKPMSIIGIYSIATIILFISNWLAIVVIVLENFFYLTQTFHFVNIT